MAKLCPSDRVRQACREVARRARNVHVVEDSLALYAASLPWDRLSHPEHDASSHYLGHGDDTVAFFLTLDAINFGSGYFPHLRKRPGRSGYFTIATALTEHFVAHGPFSAAELCQVTANDCAILFGQDGTDPSVGELMGLYGQAWRDLGRYLLDRFDGRFVRLVEQAERSTQRLVEQLAEMAFFNDVARYGDLVVPFFKRAQIIAADLAIALQGQGPGAFTDLDRLTIFADNLVPHVLHVDGLLEYAPDLAARIEREDLLVSGSPEEVELRACAVYVVERLVEELAHLGRTVTPMQIDNLLWNRGQGTSYKARPRHRCRTVYY